MLYCHGRLRATGKPFKKRKGHLPKSHDFKPYLAWGPSALSTDSMALGLASAAVIFHDVHDGVDVMTVHTKHSGLRRFCWMCITAAMLYNTAAMSAEKATACMAPVSAGCAALLGCVAQWTSGRRSWTGAAVVGIGSGISAASRCGGHRPCPRIWPRAPRKNNCWR